MAAGQAGGQIAIITCVSAANPVISTLAGPIPSRELNKGFHLDYITRIAWKILDPVIGQRSDELNFTTLRGIHLISRHNAFRSEDVREAKYPGFGTV